MHRVNTQQKSGTRTNVKRAGSLLDDDLADIAKTVHAASMLFEITVWADANAQVLLDRAWCCPPVDPEYLAGTYSMGACLDDIHSDLQVLQRERTSSAILC